MQKEVSLDALTTAIKEFLKICISQRKIQLNSIIFNLEKTSFMLMISNLIYRIFFFLIF